MCSISGPGVRKLSLSEDSGPEISLLLERDLANWFFRLRGCLSGQAGPAAEDLAGSPEFLPPSRFDEISSMPWSKLLPEAES